MKIFLKFALSIATVSTINVTTSFAQGQPLPTDPPKLKLGEALPGNLFVELAKAVNPAVVNISTTALPKNSAKMRDPMLDMLEQLYGMKMQQPQQQRRPQQIGLGTGFIIREDGLIITNNHVIEGADIINVQLSEKTKDVYEATLVGRDARTDIALIKITPKKGEKLPVAVLGSSNSVEVGEWVAAFGNPFGHGHSMTKGIISSKGRDISEINKLPLIQTDASINPGNSGGPLVNTRGQVIGVNSAIDARAQGIGFAIPIDEVKAILPMLETRGGIARGYIGVGLGELDAEAAEYLGLGNTKGSVVTFLDPKGTAAKSGLKVYDIITEFNGKEIRNSLDLMDAVSDAPIGKSAPAKVIRNNKKIDVTVQIAERAEEKTATKATPQTYSGQKAPFDLGFSLIDPTPALRQEWGLPPDMKQPVVIQTERMSVASRAGLRVGDVVLDVNKKPVSSSKDVISGLKKGSNTLRIARNTRIQIITIEVR